MAMWDAINTLRVAGQSTQDEVNTMEQNLAKLAKPFEEFTLKHDAAKAQWTAPPTANARRFIGGRRDALGLLQWPPTPRAGWTIQAGRGVAHQPTVFSFAVSNDHIKTVYTKATEYDSQLEIWRAAVPNFLEGGVQFGIVFATRADAVAFSDATRTNAYSYRIPGESEDLKLRGIPPRSPVVKRKGVLNSQVYSSIDTGDFRGKLRTNYPRTGPTRSIISAAMESGRLLEVATIFDSPGEDMKIAEITLCDTIRASKAIVRNVENTTGVKIKVGWGVGGKRGAGAMES